MSDPVPPLGALASGPRAIEALSPLGRAPAAPLALAPLADGARPLDPSAPNRADASAVEFEAAMLTSFVEPLLPDADSPIWGGTGAGAWRGLFAQEVAAELARAGGVGIAEAVRPALASAAEAASAANPSESKEAV